VTSLTLVLVLAASFLHAGWNTLVKTAEDRFAAGSLVMIAGGLFALPLMPAVPVPNAAAWSYLLASIVIHVAYVAFLAKAYTAGDLGHVYPLARETGPLLLALVSIPLGEGLATVPLVGVFAVSLGVISLAWRPLAQRHDGARPVAYALATGVMIAAYSYVDGHGTRAAGEPLSYITWMMVLGAIVFGALLAVTRRDSIVATVRRDVWKILASGLLAGGAYGVVLWTMTLAPIAAVAALREVSVVIAVLIGTILLKEPFGWRRGGAAVLVAGGIVLLATG